MTNDIAHPDLHVLCAKLQGICSIISDFKPLTPRPPIIDSSLDYEDTDDGHWLQPEHIPGIKKLREAIKVDLETLEKFLQKPESANLPPLSTNAPYLISVWDELLCAPPPVVSIMRTFQTDSHSKSSHRGSGVKVDVVADNGRQWIRVNTIKNSRLLAEFREYDSYLTSSDEDDNEGNGRPCQHGLDNSILRMGRSLLDASKANLVEGYDTPPHITLRLTRLDATPSTKNDPRIAETVQALKDMGITVEFGERENVQLPPSQPDTSLVYKPTPLLNLDLSILIALVSDLTHSSLPTSVEQANTRFIPSQTYREWKQERKQAKRGVKSNENSSDTVPQASRDHKHSRALSNQLIQEMCKGLLNEMHDQLAPYIQSPEPETSVPRLEFWTTPEARDRCVRIISKIGGVHEKRRAHALFPDSKILPSDLSTSDLATELFWRDSRYPRSFIPLLPIRIFPSATPSRTCSSELSTFTFPSPPSPFFRTLSQTCRYILSQETIPHPRALPEHLADLEIQRASVTKANPKLTAHTVESMLWGAELGWTTLTANKSSVKSILREMKMAKAAGRVDVLDDPTEDNTAALWVVSSEDITGDQSSTVGVEEFSPQEAEWLAEQEAHAAVVYSEPLPTPKTTTTKRHQRQKQVRVSPRGRNSLDSSAAEFEWLQGDDVSVGQQICELPDDENATRSRFDWRQRPPSRVGSTDAASLDTGERKKYPKRFEPPKVSVEMGEPFYEAIQNYEAHFSELLNLEEAEDETVLKQRLSTWSLDRLKEEGYCLSGMTAYWLKANQFGRPVASFSLGPGILLPDNRFENGTQVLISRIDPLKEQPLKGNIIGKFDRMLHVSFQDSIDLSEGSWRLDVGRSNIIFQRMRDAISHMHHNVASQESASNSTSREYILQGSHLRDVFLRSFESNSELLEHEGLQQPDDAHYVTHETLDHVPAQSNADHEGAFKGDMRIQSWARRYMQKDSVVVEGDPAIEGLNTTQRRAMAMMVGQRISLVQGPPGTGKTKTIIETIKLLKKHFEVPHPLLVATYTNVAVDNLVEGLAAAGVSPLRVGFGGKASLSHHTLDHKLDFHPLRSTLDELVKQSDEVHSQWHKLTDDIEAYRGKLTGKNMTEKRLVRLKRMEDGAQKLLARLGALRSKRYAVHQEMLRDVLQSADVICTTCVSSACHALKVIDFPVVFLDEASMSTEPAALIPLMQGSQHVALIGDHKQLPPVITSREALSKGLSVSLFERLTKEGVVPSVMLDTQYRMHPGISSFPSAEFYNRLLRDGTVDDVGNVHSRLHPPTSQHMLPRNTGHRPPVIFIDHAGSESTKDRSRVNIDEAHIVCSIVEDLLLNNPEMKGSDIGIIAPYVAQTSLLTRFFNTNPKYRARFKEVLGDQRAMQLSSLEIKTVDGFEGREKEVIIFSTVRNNSGGHIGFLADRRRLNVGLTRAKRGLFVVGSLNTLKAGRVSGGEGGHGILRVGKGAESWRRYAQYLAAEGLVVQLRGQALEKALYGNLPPDTLRRLRV
ncbi:hypothetical protein ONZ45_g1808 [Pleurotus djamor]|nr:hypothetical protein ONZ45_g1808 [Pleurotus djamor]